MAIGRDVHFPPSAPCTTNPLWCSRDPYTWRGAEVEKDRVESCPCGVVIDEWRSPASGKEPSVREAHRAYERAMKALNEIIKACVQVCDEMVFDGASPLLWLARLEAYEGPPGGVPRLCEVLTFFWSTGNEDPFKRLLQERVLGRLKGHSRSIYLELTSGPLRLWCGVFDGRGGGTGGYVHPAFGPEHGTGHVIDRFVRIPRPQPDDPGGQIGFVIPVEKVTIFFEVFAFGQSLRRGLAFRAGEIEAPDQESFDEHLAPELLDDLIDSRTKASRHVTYTVTVTHENPYEPSREELLSMMFQELYDLGDELAAELAFQVAFDGVDAVEAYLQEIYDKVLAHYALREEELEEITAECFIGAVLPVSELRESVERLRRSPVALLRLPEDVLDRLAIMPGEPIARPLQRAANTEDEEQVWEAWRTLVMEQAWLKIALIERESAQQLKYPFVSCLQDWSEIAHEDFWQTRLVELPMKGQTGTRFIRRVGDHLGKPAEELILGDLPEYESELREWPGIGDVTLTRWQMASAQWLRDWRWIRAGLPPGVHLPQEVSEEAQESLSGGLDELASLFGDAGGE